MNIVLTPATNAGIAPRPAPSADGAALLDGLTEAIGKHVVMTLAQRRTCALWSVHTHAFALFEHSPRLFIKSPALRCGKTLLLEVLSKLVAKPLRSDFTDATTVFRVADAFAPTLLLDGLVPRKAVGSGRARGGCVLRCVGGRHEPRRFSTFCPAAFTGVSPIVGALADRSIVIVLQRRLPSERIVKLDDQCERFAELKRKIARWVGDNHDRLVNADPDMPEALRGYAQDNWRPLVAIADAAGGDWPRRAREAALELAS